MSTTLVTGSNGFIGAAVVAQLLAHTDAQVRALIRVGSDLHRLEPLLETYPERLTLHVGSLASEDACAEAIEGVDRVIHLAAGLSGAAPEIFANTVVTSEKLLAAILARPEPPKVVLVSSFSVYGVAALEPGETVDETTPVEPRPEARDPYAFAKVWQERLFRDASDRYPLVVLRPGMVYGPGGSVMSSRVGLALGPMFLFLGADNPLPLTHVQNCASAIVVAAEADEAVGETYNVVDDDSVTARDFLARYQRHSDAGAVVPVPYPLLLLGSRILEAYHHHSEGQLPAVFTPYKTRSTWKAHRYSNEKLEALGWRPKVPTTGGLDDTFASLAHAS